MLNADIAEVSVLHPKLQFPRFNSMSTAVEIAVKGFFFFLLQSILVSIFYSKPQRLDVYTDNVLVAPTNAGWNAANTDYTLKKPSYSGSDAKLMTVTEDIKIDFPLYFLSNYHCRLVVWTKLCRDF